MKYSVICDIDGVILTCPHWQEIEDFYAHISECVPIDWAVHLVNALHNNGINIIFLTARDAKCRGYTKYQLQQLFDFPIHLYMRTNGDLREDYEIKEDYINMFMQQYNILFCIDDNVKNCEMYRKHGLTVIQV